MKISGIPYIIIVISVILAEIILLYGGKSMDSVQWVSIVVALIGVAGGIWAQVVQFKKDAQRIDSVNEKTSGIEKDTAEFRPKIDRTDKNVSEIRDGFLKKQEKFNDALNGISELLDEKRHNDRMKQEVSDRVCSPDIISSEIKTLFETNAGLYRENSELTREVSALRHENSILKADNKRLKDTYERNVRFQK